MKKEFKIATKCLHSGYRASNGAPQVMPICQSTTYRFDSTEHIGELFNMPTAHMYSRFSNPTVEAVEKKIADLEGGIGAMCTSSGQAASLISILNLCSAGDSLVASTNIYGGTLNLLAVTLKKFGIECIFVNPDLSEEEINKCFKPNTKCLFGETIANPTIQILDIEKFARIAHKNGVPLIVDNTFATPVLCRPIEHGADIVVHSTTKYMDGHALQVGGVIVDSGNFDYTGEKFYMDFVEPDESYHGVSYVNDIGKSAYITKARMQLMRDFGAYPAAHSAFLLNIGLETLALRMEKYCKQAQKVAKYLDSTGKVEIVNYPGAVGYKYNALAEKYLPLGASGVISFEIKGGREAAIRFMDSLQLASNVVHVADIRTCVLHPASETHRQLTDEQLKMAGIDPGMIRLSVGLEDIDDIISDLEIGFSKV